MMTWITADTKTKISQFLQTEPFGWRRRKKRLTENQGDKGMKTLNDIRAYAKEKNMSERAIERIIDEAESDGMGNVTDEMYKDIIVGIDCEAEEI